MPKKPQGMFLEIAYTYYFQGPLSIIAGVALGSLWGAMTSVIPEKGDTYVVPLRFLALFLGGLFSYFISSMIGWSGAGKYYLSLFLALSKFRNINKSDVFNIIITFRSPGHRIVRIRSGIFLGETGLACKQKPSQ